MSIDLITGKPGAGKSYEAVAFHILPALRNYRHVITNINLNREAFAELDPQFPDLIHIVQPTKENLRPFSEISDYQKYELLHNDKGMGAFFVIDESQMAIPAGNKNTPRDVREWYALHRHAVADVVLITQSTRKLNREVTDMVRHHIQLTKNTSLGSTKTYRRYVRDGMNGEVLHAGAVIKYNPSYFPLYQSHTKKQGAEVSSKEKTIFSHWVFRYALPAIVLLLIWSFSRIDFDGNAALSPKPVKPSIKVAQAQIPLGNSTQPLQATPTPADPAPPPLEPDYPLKGSTFLISATIGTHSNDNAIFTIRDVTGRTFRLPMQSLKALGYRVKTQESCAITFENVKAPGSFEFATCGYVKDLPPVYYLDPRNSVYQQSPDFGGMLQSGAATVATQPIAAPAIPVIPSPSPVQPSTLQVRTPDQSTPG
jgi:zona occludens toxin